MNVIPRAEIEELIALVSGIQCFWQDKATALPGLDGRAPAWIELAITSYEAKGQDEYRQYPHPQNPNALLSIIVGYRLFTLTLRCKSMDDEIQAYDVLENVRVNLRSVSAAERYRAARIAFVRTWPIAILRSPSSGRTRLEATMDVVFARLSGGMPEDDTGETIGQVNGGGIIPMT